METKIQNFNIFTFIFNLNISQNFGKINFDLA